MCSFLDYTNLLLAFEAAGCGVISAAPIAMRYFSELVLLSYDRLL